MRRAYWAALLATVAIIGSGGAAAARAAEPLAAGAAAWAAVSGEAGAARARAGEPGAETIGTSQGGEPLIVYALGDGARRMLVLGGQHGGPEANTVRLASDVLEYFAAHPEQLPPNVGLDVLLVGNPDGLRAGSRQFLSGVDPNRNWGSSDWGADAYDSDARFRPGLGGPEPFSEPETRALANWLLARRPALVVNYHSAGGFMFGPRSGLPGELATAYAEASGYRWPAPGGRSLLPYSASGSMNVWLREVGIAGILVELTTPRDTDLDRNLAGLSAALWRLTEAG